MCMKVGVSEALRGRRVAAMLPADVAASRAPLRGQPVVQTELHSCCRVNEEGRGGNVAVVNRDCSFEYLSITDVLPSGHFTIQLSLERALPVWQRSRVHRWRFPKVDVRGG